MSSRGIHHAQLWTMLAPVRPLLDAADVSEVLINGPHCVYSEREGQLCKEPVGFGDEQELMAALRLVSQIVGRSLSPTRPILEAHLPDGSRLEAIVAPACAGGPHVAIRKRRREPLSIGRLLAQGALDEPTAGLLEGLVAAKCNLIVAGGTGTGKTSLLNVLTSFIDPRQRVVTIEDARELQLQTPHVVALEAQPVDERGEGGVSIRALLRATLRMRPDRIVVGEVRDAAALDMVHAMISGHAGCMSTVHASHPLDALHRIETLALMAEVGLPLAALREQVASAVDIIVQVSRQQSGARVVQSVHQVRGVARGAYDVVALVERRGGELSEGELRATPHARSALGSTSRGQALQELQHDRA